MHSQMGYHKIKSQAQVSNESGLLNYHTQVCQCVIKEEKNAFPEALQIRITNVLKYCSN